MLFAAFAEAETLLSVATGEEKVIQVGDHTFDEVVLEENANLKIVGDTTLVVGTLRLGTGAFIEVAAEEPEQPTFRLVVEDEIDGQVFEVRGNGADGSHFPKGERAFDGPIGRDARFRIENRGFKIRKIEQSCTRGGSGAPGRPGGAGFHAANIFISLPYEDSGLNLIVSANGGFGGRGQDGGHGGRGGRPSEIHRPCPGGNGGRGGDGGPGGNAGAVKLSFDFPDGGRLTTDEINQTIFESYTIKVSAVPGRGGDPGLGGFSGASGSAGGTNFDYSQGQPVEGELGRTGRHGAEVSPVNDDGLWMENYVLEVRLP